MNKYLVVAVPHGYSIEPDYIKLHLVYAQCKGEAAEKTIKYYDEQMDGTDVDVLNVILAEQVTIGEDDDNGKESA